MNTTKSQFLQKWLPIETNHCPIFVTQKLGKNVIQNRLNVFVEESWRYCSDRKQAKKIADYCGIKDAKISDYLYHPLTTPFGEVVTSIRFIGGDLTKPAIFLMHKDFDLVRIADIQQLGAFLKQEYTLFAPKRFRWFSTKDESDLITNHEGIEGDLGYYTHFLSDLKKVPKPANFEKVQLQVASSLDWYDLYFNSYQEMYQANPFFEEMASVESKKSLQNMIDNESLFEVFIEGKWAGIIGVCKAKALFLEGYEVYEEYLLPEFRGKHLAPAVQRHLIEKLSIVGDEMLYGTIHYQNQASIKTAKRVGRKQVGLYVFADI